jgi:hypothetical protein
MGDEDSMVQRANRIKDIIEEAENREEFQKNLAEGNFEEAAQYHDKTPEELKDFFEDILEQGKRIAEEHHKD